MKTKNKPKKNSKYKDQWIEYKNDSNMTLSQKPIYIYIYVYIYVCIYVCIYMLFHILSYLSMSKTVVLLNLLLEILLCNG